MPTAMSTCSMCGVKTSVTHSNPIVGFDEVCDACQLDAHVAYNAKRAAKRAAAVAALTPNATPPLPPAPATGGSA